MASAKNVNIENSAVIHSDDFDPRVSFLYKAMLNRDPRKRRVKPVPRSQVQVNFGGLEDSEEDSDFDIGKHSKELGEKVIGKGKVQEEDTDDTNSEDDDDMEMMEDDCDNEEDELLEEEEEEGSEDEEEDSDQDDSEIDESDIDENCEEESTQGDSEMKSPEIKGLGQAWGLIDSDEDDEDYVPRKRKKKSNKICSEKSDSKSKIAQKTSKSECLAESARQDDPDSLQEAAPQGRIKVIVCCVCLSDRSADDDEIVECDNCGISVHEGLSRKTFVPVLVK